MKPRRGWIAVVFAGVVAACAPQSAPPPPPLISGTPEVGETLTATPGNWLFQPTSFTYGWRRCTTADATSCVDVGAGSTYVVVAADLGAWIVATVTATNPYGSSSTRTGAVGPVTEPGATTTTSTSTTTTTSTSTTTTTEVDPDNQPPVVQAAAYLQSRIRTGVPAPHTRALYVAVQDPDGDPLVCEVDPDGDGTFEHRYDPCLPAQVFGGSFGPTILPITFRSEGTFLAQVRVSDGHHPPVTATALEPVEVVAAEEPFDITLEVEPGAFTPRQLAALDGAVDRWETILGAGLPDTHASNEAGEFCPAFDGPVDDVHIRVTAGPEDGPGSFLALGGYCDWRTLGAPDPDSEEHAEYGWDMPSFGLVRMDEEDLASVEEQGMLEEVFAHEIGHVLGIGTSGFWGGEVVEVETDDLRLFDWLSTGAWSQLGGGNGIPPVANVGPIGSIGQHWREADLQHELMTPSLGLANPGDRPASTLTLAFLASFGYSLDMADAEPFTLPPPLPAARRPAADEHFDRAFGPGVR